MKIPRGNAHIGQIFRQIFRHAFGKGCHKHPLPALDTQFALTDQIVHLPFCRADFDRRVHKPGGTDNLLHNKPVASVQFPFGRRCGNKNALTDTR